MLNRADYRVVADTGGGLPERSQGLLSYGSTGLLVVTVALHLAALGFFVGAILAQENAVGEGYWKSVAIASWVGVGLYAFAVFVLTLHSLMTSVRHIKETSTLFVGWAGLGAYILAGFMLNVVFVLSFRTNGKVEADQLYAYVALGFYATAGAAMLFSMAAAKD